MTPDPSQRPRWHQALAYAVTGERDESLGAQARPNVSRLVAELRSRWPGDAISGHVREVRARREPWPHPVPADLMAGLGYAQLAAALGEVAAQLGIAHLPRARSVGPAAQVTATEQRLLDEVPPHHRP